MTAGIPERMMPWKISLKLMFVRVIYGMIYDKEKGGCLFIFDFTD